MGLLKIAEHIDAYRVIPRLLIFSYWGIVWHLVRWFELLPNPSTQQATFVSIIIGLAASIFAFYVRTGRDWSKQPPDDGDVK